MRPTNQHHWWTTRLRPRRHPGCGSLASTWVHEPSSRDRGAGTARRRHRPWPSHVLERAGTRRQARPVVYAQDDGALCLSGRPRIQAAGSTSRTFTYWSGRKATRSLPSPPATAPPPAPPSPTKKSSDPARLRPAVRARTPESLEWATWRYNECSLRATIPTG